MRALRILGLGLLAVAACLALARLPELRGDRAVELARAAAPPSTVPPSPGGNLAVEVRPIPSRPALFGLCHAIAVGHADPASVPFRELVAVTGGTATAAQNWCANFLALQSRS